MTGGDSLSRLFCSPVTMGGWKVWQGQAAGSSPSAMTPALRQHPHVRPVRRLKSALRGRHRTIAAGTWSPATRRWFRPRTEGCVRRLSGRPLCGPGRILGDVLPWGCATAYSGHIHQIQSCPEEWSWAGVEAGRPVTLPGGLHLLCRPRGPSPCLRGLPPPFIQVCVLLSPPCPLGFPRFLLSALSFPITLWSPDIVLRL